MGIEIPASLIGLGLLGGIFSVASNHYSNSSPEIHFASKPAILPVRKDKESNEVQYISIRTLLETRCKSLFSDFRPLWWLFNGHLQTIYCVLGDFSKNDCMWYDRKYLRLAEGGTLGIDFAPSDQSKVPEDAPIVVVQHGLTGGSHESYVRAILRRACTPVEEGGLGYRAAVINFRGCAGVPLTTPLLYSAGHTDDTRQALMYIAHRYPNAPLLGIGFSLGANVLTRYLGEEGAQTRISSACVLACPWDLQHNSDGLLNSFIGKHIYSKGMGNNLLRLVKKHLKVLIQDPEHIVAKATAATLSLKNPTLHKFDDTFTKVAGGPSPHFPFEDASAYYAWGSSHHMVQHVTVPFLAINSGDDPIVRHVPMDGGGNGFAVMALTKGGGHLGWFQAGPGYLDRWSTEPVLEWLKLFGQDVVHEPKSRGRPLFVGEDGFLREEGVDNLGCKEIEGGGLIGGNYNGDEGGMLQGL
ncbi:AB-hydrolase YheT [Phlegmacium glaucopus]|nr:AB-hydrolase YheT [Phlegmacium glaucopus]